MELVCDAPASEASLRQSESTLTRGRRSRRNKGFDETHQAIIIATVQLISKSGVDALSVSGVARLLEIDRKTVYYHFHGRDALLNAALEWSSAQLARSARSVEGVPREERTAHISRFVLENPDLIKVWIDNFISPGDIRSRYTEWDKLVGLFRSGLSHHEPPIDPELYCTIMLSAAFIAPRVFKLSVRPDLGIEEIVAMFRTEQIRVLDLDARLPDP